MHFDTTPEHFLRNDNQSEPTSLTATEASLFRSNANKRGNLTRRGTSPIQQSNQNLESSPLPMRFLQCDQKSKPFPFNLLTSLIIEQPVRGTGGITPCVSSYGAYQIDDHDDGADQNQIPSGSPLNFVEKSVEIMDREVKQLKQSRIPIIKVRWNSKRGPEFTLEHEDQIRVKYPHLFSNTTPASN
ncbi:hypothetical protein Tco_0745252 [Tanacetum coccineum]